MPTKSKVQGKDPYNITEDELREEAIRLQKLNPLLDEHGAWEQARWKLFTERLGPVDDVRLC